MAKARMFLLLSLVFASPTAFGWSQDAARTIPIVAKQFSYAPSEVRLKKGEPVTLVLTSADVVHGLKSKDLPINATIQPGQETRVTFTPSTPGKFIATCNKFCGPGHLDMKMTFIVE
jgi:cytochrome c oxidase subunit 2